MSLFFIMLLVPVLAQADTYEYTPSPETRQIFREQWEDVAITLQRSAAIRAQHAREREALEQARTVPLPPEREVNPRYMTPPSSYRDPEWFMLRTPQGLYYNYGGGMFQGPHGELYHAY